MSKVAIRGTCFRPIVASPKPRSLLQEGSRRAVTAAGQLWAIGSTTVSERVAVAMAVNNLIIDAADIHITH